MTGGGEDGVARKFVIVGVGIQPFEGLPGGLLEETVGPVSGVAGIKEATSGAEVAFVLVHRRPLSRLWVEQAAALLDGDSSIGAVVGVESKNPSATLSDVGAGLMTRSHVLHEVGGFQDLGDDPHAVLTEADLRWRIAARGYSIVTHAASLPDCAPVDLSLRGRLAVLTSNLETSTLSHCLPALILAAVTTPLRDEKTDALDLQRSPGGDDRGTLTVSAPALDGAREVVAFSSGLSRLPTIRHAAQATRRLTDRVMAGSIGAFLADTAALAGVTAEISDALPWSIDQTPQLRVLTIVPSRMPAEGHAWVSAQDSALQFHGLQHQVMTIPGALDAQDVHWPDVVVMVGVQLRDVPRVASLQIPVIVVMSRWDSGSDLSTDVPGLIRGVSAPGVRAQLLTETIQRADLIVAADEAQRDELLGFMAGCGRLNDRLYDEDASLRSILAVMSPGELAGWCSRPRRAVDLIHTYSGPEPSSRREVSVLDRVRAPIGRILGRRL